MAYARWGRTSEWYVFWEDSPERSRRGQRLAVWHSDPAVRASLPYVTYEQVRAMLAADDFSSIPGYTREAHAALRDALTAFSRDVESDSTLTAD